MAKTLQEIFDIVKDHLLQQGTRSRTRHLNSTTRQMEEICAYRSPDGLSCAVGCLIPDSLYSPDIEAMTVTDDLILRIMVNAGVISEDDEAAYGELGNITPPRIMLLRDLQKIHDGHGAYNWSYELAGVQEKIVNNYYGHVG